MMATFYAIRQKSTCYFLPAGRGRGFTCDEPMDLNSAPPRLFRSQNGAKQALRWWLQGETSVSLRDGWGDEDWNTRPREDRKAEDMEIVKVRVSVSSSAGASPTPRKGRRERLPAFAAEQAPWSGKKRRNQLAPLDQLAEAGLQEFLENGSSDPDPDPFNGADVDEFHPGYKP
jgi:hypothetical protein